VAVLLPPVLAALGEPEEQSRPGGAGSTCTS
jgi:hypothetical protein